ncbi:MAG: L,D-transpeptidase family protein [Phycisphaerae bacterium]
MARRRRKRRHRSRWSFVTLCIVCGLGSWWLLARAYDHDELDSTLTLTPQEGPVTDRPTAAVEPMPLPDDSAGRPSDAPPAFTPDTVEPSPATVRALMDAGTKAVADGNPIAARAYFNEALKHAPSAEELRFLRAELARIGAETLFSPRLFSDDPYVMRYVIKTGDTLAKIAAPNMIPADLLADVNGLRDKNMIRAGQTLKIIKGPFRAVITRDSFSLDLYLGDTFVKRYRVGLGIEGSTPAGEWRVSTKLKNPTYYPPRGGKIIAADDPNNPLGERWIGLEGVSGEAVGQLRYGIHGTIEPDSIGRNASLGCVRMYNEDVESLYTYLVEKHSTVTVE